MLEEFPVPNLDYDIASRAIVCRADRCGAQVFPVEKRGWAKEVRVLAFSLAEAQQCAEEWNGPLVVTRPWPPNLEISSVADTEPEIRVPDSAPQVIPKSRERRLGRILAVAASEAAEQTNKVSFNHWWDMRRHLQAALMKAIPKHCNLILAAAGVSDAKVKAQEESEVIRAQAQADALNIRKETRREVARQLKGVRTRLGFLKRQLREVEEALMPFVHEQCEHHHYHSVPGPMVEASRLATGLPAVPGIYFVWRNASVVYVGQSQKLSGRCTLNHPKIEPGDMFSWVEETIPRLNFAETFYIGILRPPLNFGERAFQSGRSLSFVSKTLSLVSS